MTEKLLKAKHWQIFLPVFGLPLVAYFTMVATMVDTIASTEGDYLFRDSSSFIGLSILFPILMFISIVVLYRWLWAIATGLQHKLPGIVKMKVKKFKILFLIPLFYVFLIMVIAVFLSIYLEPTTPEPSGIIIGIFMAIILPLHLVSMFGLVYSIYFVAKTFKSVELQREIGFSDFAGEFFLIWFFPIGIWIIQPKINAMMEKDYSNIEMFGT